MHLIVKTQVRKINNLIKKILTYNIIKYNALIKISYKKVKIDFKKQYIINVIKNLTSLI